MTMERRTSTISALPDEILCHILSFLPTKNSISTSVLAKRWRFMWAHVPNIDLDDSQHVHNHRGASFSDIVYRVMLKYRVQNIDNFRLSCKISPCGEFQLETCIDTAIARNVKNLYLGLGDQVRLPPRVFTYKSLVELKLHGCGDIPSSSSSTGMCLLPALQILHLVSVVYASDKSLEHLLSGCPVLQEMFVVRTNVDPLVLCYISSFTLKILVCFTNFTNNGAVAYRVKIDTPALTHLELYDYVSNDLSVGPLTSLIAADIQFQNHVPVQGDVLYSNSVLQLVGRLSNVKSLILYTSLLEVPIPAFCVSFANFFHKLTSLRFSGDWRFIPLFLVCAKNLEVLTIHMLTNDQCLDCWFPQMVPRCLLSCLTLVTIDQFRCTGHECDMIAYLLKNAKVLQMMEVYSQPFGTDFKAKFEALNHISSFKRGSEECQVVFKD